MTDIAIPERYQVGVSKIRDLDLDTVRTIREALDRRVAEPEVDQEVRPETVAASAIQIASQTEIAADSQAISEAVVAMYSVKANRDLPLDQFTEGVADALEEISSPELRLRPEERPSFIEKLKVLLNADVFALTAKAADLRKENERIYCHARILTDLRPVFGDCIEDGPVAMLLAHNLKIAFHAAGRKGDHEFFVSLDADDLDQLRRVIDRAQAKAKALKSTSQLRLFGQKD